MIVPEVQVESRLRTLRDVQSDFLGTINKYHEIYGDTYLLSFPFKSLITRDPVIIKHVLHDNFTNYPKDNASPVVKEIFKLTYNNNNIFFTQDFDFWKQNRQVATPSFLPSALANYVPRFVEYTEELIGLYEDAALSGKPLPLKEIMGSLTLKNMLFNLFVDCDLDFKTFHYQMKEALDQIGRRGNSLFGLRWLLPTEDRHKRMESIAYIQGTALDIIKQREASSASYDDLLDRLLTFFKGHFHGEEITKSLIGDMIIYLIAGHDTTASTINALYMYFSLYPEVEGKVLEEISDVIGDKTITYETANKLVYTKMVFQEALRLQTPIPYTGRISLDEDQIAGITIPKNMPIGLYYRAVNRNIKYWDNPEHFDPERFRDQRWGQSEQYAYLPFGGGHRLCIGMNFAYLEAVVTLALLLPKYKLTLMPGRERTTRWGLTSFPAGVEEMIVSHRK
jgi:cytochrome P450